MRVKLAQAGEGGGARPPPFITFTITSNVAVYALAEWADTITLFHVSSLVKICTLWYKLCKCMYSTVYWYNWYNPSVFLLTPIAGGPKFLTLLCGFGQ
jgi:hypothetical protein